MSTKFLYSWGPPFFFRNRPNISNQSRFHRPASSLVQGQSDQVPFPTPSQFPQSSRGPSTRTAARIPSGHASHLGYGSDHPMVPLRTLRFCVHPRESRATQLVETTLQVTPRQGDWKPNGETNRNQ